MVSKKKRGGFMKKDGTLTSAETKKMVKFIEKNFRELFKTENVDMENLGYGGDVENDINYIWVVEYNRIEQRILFNKITGKISVA